MHLDSVFLVSDQYTSVCLRVNLTSVGSVMESLTLINFLSSIPCERWAKLRLCVFASLLVQDYTIILKTFVPVREMRNRWDTHYLSVDDSQVFLLQTWIYKSCLLSIPIPVLCFASGCECWPSAHCYLLLYSEHFSIVLHLHILFWWPKSL